MEWSGVEWSGVEWSKIGAKLEQNLLATAQTKTNPSQPPPIPASYHYACAVSSSCVFTRDTRSNSKMYCKQCFPTSDREAVKNKFKPESLPEPMQSITIQYNERNHNEKAKYNSMVESLLERHYGPQRIGSLVVHSWGQIVDGLDR